MTTTILPTDDLTLYDHTNILIDKAATLPNERWEIIEKRRFRNEGMEESSITVWHEGSNQKHRIGMITNIRRREFSPSLTAPYGLVNELIAAGWTIT